MESEVKYNRSNPSKGLIILLLVMLYTSTDTLIFGTNINNAYLYVPRFMGFAMFAVALVKWNEKSENYSDFFLLLLMSVIILVSGVINHALYKTTFSRLISVLAAYAITCQFSQRKFIEIFDDFVFYVSVVAVVVEILTYLAPQLVQMFPAVTNTAKHINYTIFFGATSKDNIGRDFARASGVFWEPGAYAVYLVLALMFQFHYFEQRNKKRTALYILCLVLTFSTTGMIGFAMLILVSTIRKKENANEGKFLYILLIAMLLALYFMGKDTDLYNMIFGKMEDGGNSSAQTRYNALFTGLKVAWSNPLFGVSSNKMEDMMTQLRNNAMFASSSNSNTNTISYYLAAFGIPFGSFLIFGTYKMMYKISKSYIVAAGLFATLFLLYCGEMFYSFLPFTLMFYGFRKENDLYENSVTEHTS